MPIPDECQKIADLIAGLEEQRNGLQELLQEAATGQKPYIVKQIKALSRRIDAEQGKLADCIAKPPPSGPPPPPPLEAVLSAIVSLTTSHPFASDTYTSREDFGFIFSGDRTFLALKSFPDIAYTYSTDIGENTTTVTWKSGGQGGYTTGSIVMDITLHFANTIFLFGESDLRLTMTTRPPGSPVDSGGSVTLVGTGTFAGGALNGYTGTVNIRGRFSPVP